MTKQALHKKALFLSYFTIGYNVLEGVLSIGAGLWSGSIALVGFGLDSFVESLSGGVMVWRFQNHTTLSEEAEERIEQKAIRLIAYTFFILAVYVFYESFRTLYLGAAPDPNLMGIIIAVVSLVVMPLLFYTKYRTGRSLGSRSLVADSKQTLACCFMSLSLLVGLGLNYLYGIWQADPLVGFIIAAYLVREGYGAWREGKLCAC